MFLDKDMVAYCGLLSIDLLSLGPICEPFVFDLTDLNMFWLLQLVSLPYSVYWQVSFVLSFCNLSLSLLTLLSFVLCFLLVITF